MMMKGASGESSVPIGERITVAVIRRTRGVRGEVVATPLSDFLERFEPGARVFLTSPRDDLRTMRIEASWFQKNDLILKFEGVDSISEGETLAGWRVQVPLAERFEAEEGEFFIDDLVGCHVELDGATIGEVVDVKTLGGGEALVVRLTPSEESPTGNDRLIPFVHEICPEVDTVEKRIRITPPKGLLDIE